MVSVPEFGCYVILCLSMCACGQLVDSVINGA